MSSLPWNTAAPSSPVFLTQAVAERKAAILNHVASYKQLVDVRPASHLEVRPRPEMISTGIAEVDALTGGLPRGCLSELCGAGPSGKTSVLLATIAASAQREESCALIDASDSFDPQSGAAAGINFGKLLWVRCGKKLSTINRQPSVKNIGANAQRQTSLHISSVNFENNGQRPMTSDGWQLKTRSEQRLEQVLKTTDLILQSGGFGLVALDLAGIPEKFVRRIPLASWFRFQRAVEHTKTVLLVVSEFACAQTCASVIFRISTQHSAFSNQPRVSPSHSQLMETMQIEVELARTRLERKPMRSVRASFRSRAVRAG